MFALAPALATDGVLDYTDAGTKKLYNRATAPLSEENYDLSAADLTTFLGDVDTRAKEFGWEAILKIPEDIGVEDPILRTLTTEYGKISLAQVEEHVESYIEDEGRSAQNSFMLYNCLWSSVTTAAKRKLNLQRDKYQRDGIGIGPLLLKVIIQTAYVDTRSTTMQLRTNLSSLDAYMSTVKNDITSFNDYVRENIDRLAARGERSLDVIAYLFKGYEACADSKFNDFVKRKRDSYEEGDEDLTPEELMSATQNKFLTLQRAGHWMKASPEQEKIIALEAKFEQLNKYKGKTSNGKDQDKKSKKRGKENDKKNKRAEKKLPTWVEDPPKSGESETKKANGKTYYWCANHKRWSLNSAHTTTSCKGINVGKNAAGGEDNKSEGDKKVSFADEPTLKLAQALTMIVKKE